MMSSVMPSLKKVWSGELQRFSNGNTQSMSAPMPKTSTARLLEHTSNARRERVWRYS